MLVNQWDYFQLVCFKFCSLVLTVDELEQRKTHVTKHVLIHQETRVQFSPGPLIRGNDEILQKLYKTAQWQMDE